MILIRLCAISTCRLKFRKESHIVLTEHAQILHPVFEVCDSLYAHAERIAGIYIRVNAARAEHIRVYHSASENLNPSCAFTEGTPFASAKVAAYVHLGRRLCKGEVRGTQANLCLRPEHLFRKIEKHLFKVGKRHVFVNIQPFNLMEEAMRTRRDSLVAINPARAHNANRRLSLLHYAGLNRRGVGAK